ncbi:MAG: hypothetical protein AAF741_12685 [Bacteroidota bacterium]
MVADQLTQLIHQFTEAERKRLFEFLSSPYFNKREELLRLAELVPQNRQDHLDKRELWRGVYPDLPFDDVKYRLLKSDLLKIIDEFLIQESASVHDDLRNSLRLQEQLRSRNLLKRYRSKHRKMEKGTTKALAGSEWAWLQYELGRESVRYKIAQRSTKRQDFTDLSQQLERAYLLESLRMACQGLASQTVDPGELEQSSLRIILKSAGFEKRLQQDAVLAQYFHCYQMLSQQKNERAFASFISQLDQFKNWDRNEARDLLLLAVNYCIRGVNAGDRLAGEQALDLYQFGLDQQLLQERGRLSRFTFNNIVALALKSGNVKRARAFIDLYAEQISPAYRQSTAALNQARLAYEEGQLNEAMQYLQAAEDQDVLTTLNIRVLQLRVYQQLAEQRLFDASLDAFDIYLRRRKDSLDYHYKAYRKLVSYLRRYRRLNPHEPEKVEDFRHQVMEEQGLPEKNWLLKMCDG